tara:strand:- start:48 stop:434 length:387 start_codon:yes stop_codon:yes gene_type:complete
MALTGNCFTIRYSNHATETTTETVEHSDGTIIEVQTPVQIEEIETYSDVYLVVTQIENFNYWSSEGSTKSFLCFYAAYESQEARDNDIDDYLFRENLNISNVNLSDGLYPQVYNLLKQFKGLTDLIDG